MPVLRWPGATARYSCFSVPVETGTPPRRRRKVHFIRNTLAGIPHSIPLRLLSTLNPLRWASMWAARPLAASLYAKSALFGTPWRAFLTPLPCASSPNRTRLRLGFDLGMSGLWPLISCCRCPVIARRPIGPTWQSVPLVQENGFPRRCAPRNDKNLTTWASTAICGETSNQTFSGSG